MELETSAEQRAGMLERTEWAAGLTWRQLVGIAKHMTAFKATKGSTVFEEGDREVSMGLVISGALGIFRKDMDGGRKLLVRLTRGQVFGDMALIDEGPRSASAVAENETVFLLVTRNDFFELINRTPRLGVELTLRIARLLSSRLRDTSGRLCECLSTS